jgi:hypothetical protein
MLGRPPTGLYAVETDETENADAKASKNNNFSTLIVPASDSLNFVGQDEALCALFDGTLVLAGIWQYGWADNGEFDVSFAPDADTLAQLPYWRDYARAETIVIENSYTFAGLVLSHKARCRLKARPHWKVRGAAVIEADHFRTALYGETPIYQVNFRRLVART